MNKEEYLYMNTLEKTDQTTYDFINNILTRQRSEISFASHEIKNQLSFIRSSYQLISRKHPESENFSFWPELGNSINNLIYFMDRTSLYRYSFKSNPANMNITGLLYSLPDLMDERFPSEIRRFCFDTDVRTITIHADYERLVIAFTELLANACEASQYDDTICISSHVDEESNRITITLTNPGTINIPPDTDPLIDAGVALSQQLCTPFYTDKKSHAGLGLPIVYQICCTHNADFHINCTEHSTSTEIIFPIIDIS